MPMHRSISSAFRVVLFLLAFTFPVFGQAPGASAGIQKINHVVFLIKENRSYDNMFGAFNAKYGTKTCALSSGQVVPMGRAPDRYEHDVDHEWSAALLGMDGGKMDQFDLIGLGNGHQRRQQRRPSYLPPVHLDADSQLLRLCAQLRSRRRHVLLAPRSQLSQSPVHHRRRVLRCPRQSLPSRRHQQLGMRRTQHGGGSGKGARPPAQRRHHGAVPDVFPASILWRKHSTTRA